MIPFSQAAATQRNGTARTHLTHSSQALPETVLCARFSGFPGEGR